MNLTEATAKNIVVDGFGAFPKGMNYGKAPQLLESTEVSYARNVTLRGDFLGHRPTYRKLAIDYAGAFSGDGLYQGCCYYQPDYGPESIVAAVGGRLYQFFPGESAATTADITGNVARDPLVTEHFLWQAEKYIINQDGQSQPRIFDGANTFAAATRELVGTVHTAAVVPAVGGVVAITLDLPYDGIFYQKVNLNEPGGNYIGQFLLQPNAATSPQANISLLGGYGAGVQIAAGSNIYASDRWCTLIPVNVPSHPSNLNQTYTIPLLIPFTGAVGDGVFLSVSGSGSFGGGVNNFTGVVQNANANYTDSNGIQWPAITVFFSHAPFGFTAGQFIQLGSNTVRFSKVNEVLTAFTPPGVISLLNYFTGNPQQLWINTPGVTSGTNEDKLPYFFSPISGATANIGLKNLTATAANPIPAGSVITTVPQLPIGRAGTYVLGRNWMALSDGLSYIASDMAGGSSGSEAEKFRDAVLYATENTKLAGGGSFRVPGGAGDIKFMADLATLDKSLGQGSIQIGTSTKIFSCDAPYLTSEDRSTWADSKNPIVTVSLIGQAGVGQRSAVVCNSDLIFRSNVGLCSLVLARREFNSWPNTPISKELGETISGDPPELLNFCSAIQFDNRFLFTTQLVQGTQGVYGELIGVINFDPQSTLQGKAPAIYDGFWDGLKVLQFVKGRFSGVERCFAFVANTTLLKIELWELLPSPAAAPNTPVAVSQYLDNGTDRITMTAETGILFQGDSGKNKNDLCQLKDGELYLASIQGKTDVALYFRPDYDRTWRLWRKFTLEDSPYYQPRIGLGEPPADFDTVTKRAWRDGYSFQFKLQITGRSLVMGGRFSAAILPTPTFAPPQFARPVKPLAEPRRVLGPQCTQYILVQSSSIVGVNQTYSELVVGKWVSYDGLYAMQSFGLYWVFYATANPFAILYTCTFQQFPFYWSNPVNPADTIFGQYVCDPVAPKPQPPEPPAPDGMIDAGGDEILGAGGEPLEPASP